MKGIKTLADEIREAINLEGKGAEKEIEPQLDLRNISSKARAVFLASVLAFKLEGTEKNMIRLDEKTDRLLKMLKAASGISMNKFIAYAVNDLLKRNPWIIEHIKDTFKNTKL